MHRSIRVLAAGCLCFAASNISAQSFADLAGRNHPGRHKQLVETAKGEGSVTFYTSIPEKDMAVLSADFEKRFGVRVNIWRAPTDKVVQRLLAERQANRWDFDAVGLSGPEMEVLYNEKLLQEVASQHHQELVPGILMPHRGWAPDFLIIFAQAYNTNLLKKEELPRSYEDLLDPRWKGMLGVEAKDQEWYCTLVKHMGREKGVKLFRAIVEKNGWSVRKGHTLLTNLVASGEVPLALTVYGYMVDQAKQKGAPVEWFAIEPLIGRSNGIGVSRRPPHPHAALLFYEYMIGDAQPLFVKMDYLSPVKQLASYHKGARIVFVDPAAPREEVERCDVEFNELLKGR